VRLEEAPRRKYRIQAHDQFDAVRSRVANASNRDAAGQQNASAKTNLGPLGAAPNSQSTPFNPANTQRTADGTPIGRIDAARRPAYTPRHRAQTGIGAPSHKKDRAGDWWHTAENANGIAGASGAANTAATSSAAHANNTRWRDTPKHL
jgi:hypothetical protein